MRWNQTESLHTKVGFDDSPSIDLTPDVPRIHKSIQVVLFSYQEASVKRHNRSTFEEFIQTETSPSTTFRPNNHTPVLLPKHKLSLAIVTSRDKPLFLPHPRSNVDCLENFEIHEIVQGTWACRSDHLPVIMGCQVPLFWLQAVCDFIRPCLTKWREIHTSYFKQTKRWVHTKLTTGHHYNYHRGDFQNTPITLSVQLKTGAELPRALPDGAPRR